MVKYLALWVQYSRRNCLSKTAKFLGGKSANELIHSLLNFEFLTSQVLACVAAVSFPFLFRRRANKRAKSGRENAGAKMRASAWGEQKLGERWGRGEARRGRGWGVRDSELLL